MIYESSVPRLPTLNHMESINCNSADCAHFVLLGTVYWIWNSCSCVMPVGNSWPDSMNQCTCSMRRWLDNADWFMTCMYRCALGIVNQHVIAHRCWNGQHMQTVPSSTWPTHSTTHVVCAYRCRTVIHRCTPTCKQSVSKYHYSPHMHWPQASTFPVCTHIEPVCWDINKLCTTIWLEGVRSGSVCRGKTVGNYRDDHPAGTKIASKIYRNIEPVPFNSISSLQLYMASKGIPRDIVRLRTHIGPVWDHMRTGWIS